MNINISQAQNTGGWATDANTIYLTMPIPSPSDLLDEASPGDSSGSSYACPVCNVQFATRSQLMGHTRKHMKDKLFQCKLCEQNFPSHKELKAHMGNKGEGEGPYPINCGICGSTFPSQACLTHHLNCHKQAGSAPVIIDNPAAERSEYQIQIQVQPQDPMALDLDVLQGGGHTLTVDSSQIDISHLGHVVVIPSSGIITTSSAAHHQHLNNNSSMANNPPPSKPKAKRKKRANNNNAANNNHSGVIAVANSIQHGVAHAHTISGTNIHVEILANPNHRYSCSLCNKTFKNSQHVQRHLRIHTGEKPFSCTVCSQSFSLNHNLQRHMRTHTGEKPHKCPVCTKDFAEGHNLKRHMISAHDGPTPYICTICSRKFAENSILKKHQSKAHKTGGGGGSTSSSTSSGN